MLFYVMSGIIAGISLGFLIARIDNTLLAKEGYVMIKVPPGMKATVQPILSGMLHAPEELERN